MTLAYGPRVLKRTWSVGSTTEVDFTNILQAAFKRTDLKSAKNTVKPSVFFALLGSACFE